MLATRKRGCASGRRPTRSSCPHCWPTGASPAGLLLGLAFFAAVDGLAYVLSLFYQTALGLTPARAAIALGPLIIGMIVDVLRVPAARREARPGAVIIGLGFTIAGTGGVWATVLAEGAGVSVWLMAPSLLVLGLGMGACFSSICDVALGDVAPAKGRQRQRLTQRGPAAGRGDRLRRRHHGAVQPAGPARRRPRDDG